MAEETRPRLQEAPGVVIRKPVPRREISEDLAKEVSDLVNKRKYPVGSILAVLTHEYAEDEHTRKRIIDSMHKGARPEHLLSAFEHPLIGKKSVVPLAHILEKHSFDKVEENLLKLGGVDKSNVTGLLFDARYGFDKAKDMFFNRLVSERKQQRKIGHAYPHR